MDEILEKVRLFAEKAHGKQKRKYSGEAFIRHPERVMEVCRQYTDNRAALAAALLHDVLEDTPVRKDELAAFLEEAMDKDEANATLRLTIDLTDTFTTASYPRLNRSARKKKEAARLRNVHPLAQTVKYADLIDNAVDITERDPDFARVFLRECEGLLAVMDKGDPELYKKARQTVDDCLARLKKAPQGSRKNLL